MKKKQICYMIGLVAILLATLLISCGACLTNSCKYDQSNKIFVPLVDNQNPSTNLSEPLHVAVKRRLNRVGIDVVSDEDKNALKLAISLHKAQTRVDNVGSSGGAQVGMDTNLVDVRVTLKKFDDTVITGPETFRVDENVLVGAGTFSSSVPSGNQFTPAASNDNFRRAELNSEVDKLAKAIVQHFFAKKK